MKFQARRSMIAISAVAALAGCGTATTPTPAVTATATASASPSPSLPAGFTAHGFPTVTATTDYTPGTGATMSHGEVTVTIPAGAFATPLKFQLLEGDLGYWQGLAPAGQQVLAAFAFRSVDPSTGQLVVKYDAPVVVAVDEPLVGSRSIYANTSATDPPQVSTNPVPPVIAGHALKHGNIASAVGWIVTSPR